MVSGLKLQLMGCAMPEFPIWGVCHSTYILILLSMMCLHPPEPSKHHARCTCLCCDYVCQHQHALVATVAITSIASIMEAIHATEWLLNPEPYHTLWLSGRRWVEELKDGHPNHITDNIGVQPAVFSKLEQKLVLRVDVRYEGKLG